MSKAYVIVVFEHSRLCIGEQGFEQSHFDALVKYNDVHGGKFFAIGHRKITFKSYVGVIQAGNKVIEILPKVDKTRQPGDVQRWQRALLYMLRRAGYIKQNATENAVQNIGQGTLMDLYLFAFLKEVESLVHGGLVRKYKQVQRNHTALKGRLLIEKQVSHNLIHQARFYTEHTVYDRDNIYNSILKTALTVIVDLSLNVRTRQEAEKLLLYFEDVRLWQGDEAAFCQLKPGRKTASYTQALTLAKMIILSYCPDLKSGSHKILALLFDMNVLFEKFVYRELKRFESAFAEIDLTVKPQNSRSFWEHKTIRPDLLVSFKRGSDVHYVVIDTKWKIVEDKYPSDRDLQQMFAYNIQFDTAHAMLLYPSIGQANSGKKAYSSAMRTTDFPHSCEMYFVSLFEKEGHCISSDFGKTLIEYLIG